MEKNKPDYPVINYDAKLKTLPAKLKEYGVVVIENVLSDEECDQIMEELVDNLTAISSLDKDNIAETWNAFNLPPQTRPGMFQALVGNLPAVWRLRSDPRIKKMFDVVYSDLRDKKGMDYIVSNDGITIKPGFMGPYNNGKDWAHLDQTDVSLGYDYCIQGQVVLSNTSASFRASVKSHLIHEKIIELHGDKVDYKANWLKIEEKYKNEIEDLLSNMDGHWQIPIHAKKGSFIMWFSTVVHSSKLQDQKEVPTEEDKWFGWRGVVYISYRPAEEFKKGQLARKYKHILKNRICNHWGTKVFKTDPAQTRFNKPEYSDKIKKLIKNPEKVYEIEGLDLNLTKEQEKMAGNVV